MGHYFGTDGIRGPVGGPLVNGPFFTRVGQAVADWIGGVTGSSLKEVVIARDPRPSGPQLQDAIARGVGRGCRFTDAGILPTPALARLVLEREADLGVMVTASHNPSSDNGVKFFTREGRKLSAAEEEEVETLIAKPVHAHPVDTTFAPRLEPLPSVGGYLDALEAHLSGIHLGGWRVVIDAANGATRQTSPVLFRRLGAEVTVIGDSMDGNRINDGCGSEHPRRLAEKVVETGAHLGIAHDGDGDRLVCVDERGELLDGDRLMVILARDGIERGWLGGGRVVATVQSNLGLDRAVAQAGGTVLRVPVGDRWVSEKMAETDTDFGGENSGHLIFREFGWCGDGLLAALRLCDVLVRRERPLSELGAEISLFPQRTYVVRIAEKKPLQQCPLLVATQHQWEARLGSAGRILVRYSGTEPILRILTEAEDPQLAEAAGEALVTTAQKELGATG